MPSRLSDHQHSRADLPRKERWSWIISQDNAESKSELKQLWAIFKSDPIEPVRIYFRKYVTTGLGLFVEVGDQRTLLEAV
jgi:hypothetical protein